MNFKNIKRFVKSSPVLKKCYEHLFQRPVFNYYKSLHNKRVLISYSTYHFKSKRYLEHSNNVESKAIAEIFHELGYIVDIFNNTYSGKVDPKRYDVIFGGGDLMFKMLTSGFEGQSVYYGTGSHPWHCTLSSLKRASTFFKRKNGYYENSLRLQSQKAGLAANFSNSVICIGNSNTVKTFQDYGCLNVTGIDPSFYSEYSGAAVKKKENANKNFMYFGSYGLIHKGLDLVIDAFMERPDLQLHVCGHLDREVDFLKSLGSFGNVHFHGFFDISSPEFVKLGQKCGFVILPSASEGTSTAILTAMGICGHIPVVTDSCGVDMPSKGYVIKNLDVASVATAIENASSLTDREIQEIASQISVDTNHRYTISNYKTNLQEVLNRVLS